MIRDLSSKLSISTATLFKWYVNSEFVRLTDYKTALTVYEPGHSGSTSSYSSTGEFLSITNTVSELKASPGDLTITLSGVDSNRIGILLNTPAVKGTEVWIYRAYFNPATNQADPAFTINSGNPELKYRGIVTNYEISDDVDTGALIATSTITLNCSSKVEVLSRKVSGRRTNPVDFPNDQAFKRVQALANSNFNFGAP